MKIVVLMATLLLSSLSQAETVYITDEFNAPLRTGQTNAYRIRANLPSGTKLKVLETNQDSGYTKVATQRGTEGWVLSRYLVKQPVARTLLAQAQQQVKQLKEQNAALKSNRSESQQTNATLTQENKSLIKTNTKLEEELNYIKQVSSNAISINQRNQQLIQENQELKNNLDLLSSDNERLKDSSKQDFFLMGAGTILLGLVIGLVLPSLKPKRKDTGWI